MEMSILQLNHYTAAKSLHSRLCLCSASLTSCFLFYTDSLWTIQPVCQHQKLAVRSVQNTNNNIKTTRQQGIYIFLMFVSRFSYYFTFSVTCSSHCWAKILVCSPKWIHFEIKFTICCRVTAWEVRHIYMIAERSRISLSDSIIMPKLSSLHPYSMIWSVSFQQHLGQGRHTEGSDLEASTSYE